MILSPAKPGWHKIENKWTHTDSLMEATIIKRLVAHGFDNGRWHRYRFGINKNLFRYTPDVHLSILHNDMSRRALIEFKPRTTAEFKKKDRLRMVAASKFYRDALCFLYIEKTKQWYIIEPTGKLFRVNEPKPGFVPVSKLPRPRFLIPYYHPSIGRVYWENPGKLILRKTMDGVGYAFSEVFHGPRARRRRYYRRRKF